MSDEKQNEQPGIPPGQPSDPGAGFGNENLANAPVFDRGEVKGAKVQAAPAEAATQLKGSDKRIKNQAAAPGAPKALQKGFSRAGAGNSGPHVARSPRSNPAHYGGSG